jgi:peptide/nickel transport system substrate-binding protein
MSDQRNSNGSLDLMRAWRERRFDRRGLMLRAGAAGLSATALGALGTFPVAAQDASPEAAAAEGEAIQSITRDEFHAMLRENFAFEEPQNQGGAVIWAQTADISTVNGLLTADYPTIYVTGLIFEPLVSVSPIDGQVIPALADSYEVSPDGKTYTFHLNKDAKWHDGTDVTAEDVKFTFDVALDETSPNPRRSSILPLLESYRVIDDDTFEMVAKEPFATFLYDVSSFVLTMPKHIWENVPPGEWGNDPGSTGQDPARVVGTGPFKFQEWRQGESVTLARNDQYYDPNMIPVIDELIMRVLPDPTTEVEALKAGEIDIVEVVPAPQVEEVQNTEGLKVDIYPGWSFSYIGLNMDPEKSPFFQDQRVRQALFIGIDKEAIKDNIYLGLGEVARGTQPKLSYAYSPESFDETYDFDPERARALLAEAGWTDTNGNGIVDKDGVEFSFELVTSSGGGATVDQLLAELQQKWREIGVEMTPVLMEWSAMLDLTSQTHEFDAVLQGFGWDASLNQGALFRCDSYNGGFNDIKYCNEEYDALDELQLRELDREKRRQLLIEQSQIVWNDLPVLIFRIGVERPGYSERLHNFFPNGMGGVYWSLPWVWIEQ